MNDTAFKFYFFPFFFPLGFPDLGLSFTGAASFLASSLPSVFFLSLCFCLSFNLNFSFFLLAGTFALALEHCLLS